MRLSDVMSAMNLAVYAEIGLVIFSGVFVAVATRLFVQRSGEDWETERYLPLSDARPEPASEPGQGEDQ
jgi:cbb3-type cytochrome oxidase subunit 3